MVRRNASETATHVAADRCSIVAAPDGTHAAIVEAGRIVVVELGHGTPVAEVGVATALEHTDVAWIGAPPRLLVLSRRATHSTVHLIDLDGPRARAEIQIEGMMRIGATVGTHALVIGTSSTAVLTAGDAHLTPYQFPSRSVPSAAGVAARQFVVAIAGAIEEWDPQQRAPRKRLRLPRPAAISQVGGTERVVWVTTNQDPKQIDVIAQANLAQPRVHELPEPIASVSAHPHRDLLACLGRDTGRLYIVDLEGRAAVRTIDLPGIDRADAIALFAGPTLGVVAARAGQPLGVFVLDGRVTPSPLMFQQAPAAAASEPRRVVAMPASAPPPDADEARRSSLFDAPLPARDDTPARGPRPAEPAAQPRPLAAAAVAREPAPPPATPPARADAGPRPATPGLASLQLRGIAAAPSGPARLRRLGSEPATAPSVPAGNGEPARPRPRELTDAPARPPVVRPPIGVAMVSLAPRTLPTRCSPAEYQALLDRFQQLASTTALRAIAQDWDSGRLAFSTHDRPPFEAEVLGIVGRRSGLSPAHVVEAAEALDEASAALANARSSLTGRLSPFDLICREHRVGKLGELVLLFVAAPALWG